MVNIFRAIHAAVDIAAHARAFNQLQIVVAGKQSNVVHLRFTRHEELDSASDKVLRIVAPQRVVISGVDLIDVQIRSGVPAGAAAAAVGSIMNILYELFYLLVLQEPGSFAVTCDIQNANAIMCIQHSNAISW